MKISSSSILLFLQFANYVFYCINAQARYKFLLQETPYTRLCSTKDILTVNGQFPGPTLFVQKGETIIVDVTNSGRYNVTIHWHGVAQPRNPWSDGPEFINQCPIQPGHTFSQKVILSTEEGTLWWHAHSDWTRATVHGVIVIKPKAGTSYPFPKPSAEVPIVIGNWWKQDIMQLYDTYVATKKIPPVSDSYLINGQPGDFFKCSKSDTFKLNVDQNQTIMLRIVNAAIENIVFFGIAKHTLKIVGTDGSYTKPYQTDYIAIAPGQTIDALLDTNQTLNHYYMALKSYDGAFPFVPLNLATTTAILQYNGAYTPSKFPPLPKLPSHGDTSASIKFTSSLRSLGPVNVPLTVDKHLMMTLSLNLGKCVNNSCAGRGGVGVGASISNISYMLPKTDILKAYYNNISGVYGTDFPDVPRYNFDYTGTKLAFSLWKPRFATEVNVLEYNTNVELVFQGTSLVSATEHPVHLHGYSFYVVGWGFGNFNKDKDPLNYNLVDPPFVNTITVPRKGWTAIRFKADNPGVWFMHCHLEIHSSWGMDMTFIVKEGQSPDEKMLPQPSDMPPC